MSDYKLDEAITSLLATRIAAGDFPSAIYAVAECGRIRFADALGEAVREPERHVATLDTIYDLASLTKPLITGLLCARRVEQGKLTLDDFISHYLKEFDTPDKHAITLRHLLTHTSGLPAWRPLYIATNNERHRVLNVIADEPLETAPGAHVRYSDLNFITLGLLLEKLDATPLALIARQEIFAPLDLQRTFFHPETSLRDTIAASETGNAYERDMSNSDPATHADGFDNWRTQHIWGEVHDGNAHFLGGAAGHAGLFSTAFETQRLASQFLAKQTQLLSPSTCQLFSTNMTEGLEEARSFAWQLATTKDSTAGADLAPDSFGHLGFTGTSCWIDPTPERIFILLTNRTHARPQPFVNINSVRRRFHTLASAALQRHDL